MSVPEQDSAPCGPEAASGELRATGQRTLCFDPGGVRIRVAHDGRGSSSPVGDFAGWTERAAQNDWTGASSSVLRPLGTTVRYYPLLFFQAQPPDLKLAVELANWLPRSSFAWVSFAKIQEGEKVLPSLAKKLRKL